MKGARDCPITGCTEIRKPEYLMCLKHWRRVPKLLNYAVYDTWNEYQRKRTVEALNRYRAARAAAIEAVCLKEGVAVPEAER
jgi:hypothetical protein